MKTLIIIEYVPEETKMFLADLTQEEFEKFKVCHNEYLGAAGCKAEGIINELLEFTLQYNDLLEGETKDKPILVADKIDYIIHTGVLM